MKVLFIGNSQIQLYDLPGMMEEMSRSAQSAQDKEGDEALRGMHSAPQRSRKMVFHHHSSSRPPSLRDPISINGDLFMAESLSSGQA